MRCWLVAACACVFLFANAAVGARQVDSRPSVDAQVWLTTADQSLLLHRQPDDAFVSDPALPANITVDRSRGFQNISGFGAALTEASAYLLTTLKQVDTDAYETLLQQLFGRSPGIGLSMLRVPLGTCDFSLPTDQQLTFDDNAADANNDSLPHFSIELATYYIIPVLTDILSVNPHLNIVVSPWTPPLWMKTTGALGNGTLASTQTRALAAYVAKAVAALETALATRIFGLTLQNEPLFEPQTYGGMYLSADQAVAVLARLVAELQSVGLQHVRLLAYDHNWDHPEYPLSVLQSSVGAAVAGTSFHCYAGSPSAQQPLKSAFPDKEIHMLECSGGGWQPGSWWDILSGNVKTLYMDTLAYGSQSVLHWNLVLDETGSPQNHGCTDCRGMVTLDARTLVPTFNQEYWGMGHFSQFLSPDMQLVSIDTPTLVACARALAFAAPSSRATLLVLLNTCSQPQQVVVRDGGWVLSNVTIPVGLMSVIYQLPTR